MLLRHRRGEAGAFRQLVEAYRRPVYSYLGRCGVAVADRDDLFQDIFIKIHRAAGSFDISRRAHPWIFTIVANTVRNHLRRLRVRQLADAAERTDGEAGVLDPIDPAPGGERQLAARETVREVERGMRALSAIQRQVVLLASVERLSMAAISTALDLPIGTVKTHLRRARLALARTLMRQGIGGAA